MEIRELHDADLPAIEALLAPVEARSLFLLGNARREGVDDRGGRFGGIWLGAFEDGALRGLIAWFRGPDSITPACEGHGELLVPALLERLDGVPRQIVGTADRVGEVLARAPASWRHAARLRELLMTVPIERFRPRPGPVEVVDRAHAAEVAVLRNVLTDEAGLPRDPQNEAWAADATGRGEVIGARDAGRLVAMSCVATHSGRWLHVGGTVSLPEHRRRGHAGACVSELVRRFPPTVGAALFTGAANAPAIRLYESLGFVRDAAWELCFLER